ncbi:MAG TPA: aromatic amino acid transport family protein [Candidatus Nanoarchaeia archaeon]|nr:aromatic amino acid transport family protein [Candidatus Nanoarchaeia archaeon]
MKEETKKFISAVSVLVGTSVGAGFLGMPYVVSKVGFVLALILIVFISLVILFLNLCMGEVTLRTKGKHQLSGYAEKYLGKKGKFLMEFAVIFGIYSAIIAYLFGIGESLSFLAFGNIDNFLYFSLFIGILMSALVWRGITLLKKLEKFGVASIILILIAIILIFFNKINYENLIYFNSQNLFLPIGVILFSFLSFSAVPHIEIILERNEKLMKKSLFFGSFIPLLFYLFFTFIVIGYKGVETPEIATFALGAIFVLLGVFTMLNAYLSLGNALMNNFVFDNRMGKFKGWFLAVVLPVFIFIIIKLSGIFSFTKVLSIGGVISGGLTGILVLLMVKRAKKKGNRKPEYKMPVSGWIIGLLILFFLFVIIQELVRMI